MNLLADLLMHAGQVTPDAPAIEVPDDRVWTHGDLAAASARMAHALVGLGVAPGDRVAVQLPKSVPAIALHLACIRAGAVYLPLNSAYTPAELGSLLDDAEPTLLVRDQAIEHSVRCLAMDDVWQLSLESPEAFDDVARDADDPAAILYTSGTTGRPKGAVLSHGNLAASATTLVTSWGFTPGDVLLHILPLFHTHGLFVALHTVLASGGSLILQASFDPVSVVADLPRASVLMGVPTHYVRLLAEPTFTRAVTSGIRLFTSGSAPMLVSTHEEFTARTGAVILERYGMTETCMLTSNPLVGVRKAGTVGPPLPGVQLRLAGESPAGIQVRGPNVFAGYWRRPELRATEFTDDGWFITGDLGTIDADGYVEIVGRSKDLIITGGLNVYPKEIELLLDTLPGVGESAVIGVQDPDFGEAVVAVIVAEDPAHQPDPEHLRELARVHLAGFKVPKRIHVADELPRNAMGKVEKARLRAEYS
ncbi:MAG: AMP-binding protein [Candidatus Nanopelagicales bacterium]|nr:AMP-binding protein [Candidatus Nanopelagicales bacterium]